MKKWNKLLALLLAMVMALGMTVTAFAEGEETAEKPETAPAETTETEKTEPAEGEEAEAPAYNGTIVILHTNDVHGAVANYAKVAALKAKYEAEGAYVLVMDAGDYMQGEPAVNVSQGATAVELMNMAGYDVTTLGNHEFDFGYANLVEQLKKAEFKVSAANVTYEGKAIYEANLTFEAPDGTKVGVFGLSTPETGTKAHPSKIKGVKFAAGEDLFAAAQAQVDALTAAECDYIVCLAHLGIDDESTGNRSIDLLEKVTGIDVMINGHSHSDLAAVEAATNAERKVGETVVTSTGTKLESIGVVTIKDGAITTENVATEGITVAEDDAIVARAAAINAEIDADYGKVFAKTEVKLEGTKSMVRSGETNLGNLITDAMLWFATKDGELPVAAENVIALTNGGGIRASIEVGDITKKDVNTVLPFGNTVAYITIGGADLLAALEASTFCTPEPVGAFAQVSGINFTVDTLKAYDAGELYEGSTYAAPKSINRVTINSINGKDFNPEATYAVVTNDFTAAGGDTYGAFAKATVVDTGVALDEAVMAYITEELKGVVTAEQYGEPAGRITIKGFSDVTASNWFAGAVAYVTEKGLMDAVDGAFKPSDAMTHADFVTALYRLAGSPEVTGENTFSDVADDAAYKNAVIWANACGYVTGNPDGTFAPEGTLQRQQIAAILYRAVKPEAADTDLSVFADADKIQGYATDAVKWMVAQELLKGDAENTIDARDAITRAQAATILQRFEEKGLTFAAVEETPAEGEAEKPAEGEAEKPAEGEAEKPAEGEAEKPTEGEAEKPAEGETETPAEEQKAA